MIAMSFIEIKGGIIRFKQAKFLAVVQLDKKKTAYTFPFSPQIPIFVGSIL